MRYIDLKDYKIKQLRFMKKEPTKLYYKGNLDLLKRDLVSIVGTRRPSAYTKEFTYKIARALSNRGVVIVSGAAMGVDAIAHKGAKSKNTIAVMANGLDIRYPKVNQHLIKSIEDEGLTISFFEPGFKATRWSFVVRNELIVALGKVLIVTEASLNSGTSRSIEFAKKMGKEIYVLPHRLNESIATNQLIKNGKAKVIYDIDEFANKFGKINSSKDEFIQYLETNPSYDEAVSKYGSKIFEAELNGLIAIENGNVRVI